MSDLDSQHDSELKACYRYVVGRQTTAGGFSFYLDRAWGVEEPNAVDSCAAVAILKMLGRPVPQLEKCTEWLLAQQRSDGSYPTLVIGHAVLRALRTLGKEPLHDPRSFLRAITQAQGFTDPSGLDVSGWLADALRSVELCRDFGIAVGERTREEMASWLTPLWTEDGGFGTSGTNLFDTGLAVELTVGLALPVHHGALGYAQRCEGPPFGFNLTPACAASSLDVQRAGLKVLGCFGANPCDPSLIRGYVGTCQTARGGFGRMPGAIAGLSETLHALEILSILARRDSRAPE